MELNDFIYDFNLVTTLNGKREGKIDRTKEIDLSNSISIYDVVKEFNDLYLNFKKEYDILNPQSIRFNKIFYKEFMNILDLYKLQTNPLKFAWYRTYENDKELAIITNYKGNDTILSFIKIDNKYYCLINDYSYNFLDLYDKLDGEKQNISGENLYIVKKYLKLASKYQNLIYSYYTLNNELLFGNGITTIHTKIEGNLFSGLNSFIITCGNIWFNSPSDVLEFHFTLGNNLELNFFKSNISIGNNKVADEQSILELANSLYVHRSKLPNIYKKEDNIIRKR